MLQQLPAESHFLSRGIAIANVDFEAVYRFECK